jgi:hypothetical protein
MRENLDVRRKNNKQKNGKNAERKYPAQNCRRVHIGDRKRSHIVTMFQNSIKQLCKMATKAISREPPLPQAERVTEFAFNHEPKVAGFPAIRNQS